VIPNTPLPFQVVLECTSHRVNSRLLQLFQLFIDSYVWILDIILGRAMAQAVSRWPFTTEAQVRARFDPCGICGGQSGTGAGFYPSSSVFPCQYHSTVAPALWLETE
jgi:hypothetical protein